MIKVFLTGGTGYVGGEALYRISAAAIPNIQITCLVRDGVKEDIVRKAFPDVRVVRGDLDDAILIEEEASQADVVLNLASTSHARSATAIANGLTRAHRTKPGYWIQISGASMFSGAEIKDGSYGQPGSKIYNDLDGANEIISTITANPKRIVDNLVLAQQSSKVKTALVIGPLIYGQGRGPVNTRSVQAPELARVTLETGQGFRLGAGLSSWSNIHVQDVSALFFALLEAAIKNLPNVWNTEGIYFPANGKLTFGELSALTAQEAHSQGFISSASVEKEINAQEADSLTPHGAVLWGTNAVAVSARAQAKLNWHPSMPSLKDCVGETVRIEAERLKISPAK